MSKHTPGPWTWGEEAIELTSSDGRKVMVQALDADPSADDMFLIAAAPDLLEALELLMGSQSHHCTRGRCPKCDQARVAIAKARGES